MSIDWFILHKSGADYLIRACVASVVRFVFIIKNVDALNANLTVAQDSTYM